MGTISLQKLEQAMHLGNLNEQVVLRSKAAFSQISFKSYEVAEARIYYHQKAQRDLDARRQYREIKPATSILDEIYILDLMRGAKDGTTRL